MSNNTTEYLIREIKQYLKHSPEAANELLAAVAEGMRYYKHDVLAARNIQTVNSLSMVYTVITKKKFTRTDLACILPSLFIAMPNRFSMTNATVDGSILQKFFDGVNREHRGSRDEYLNYCAWISSCHGEEVAEWFDSLMYWAIYEGLVPEWFGGESDEEV